MRKIFLLCVLMVLTACTSAEKEMDIIQQIERDLETIVNSNALNKISSNPNDYIEAHLNEFENIVSQKEIAINHFLSKFEKSDENGLEEYIMAAASVEILGEENPVKEWSTGKEWYEKYISLKE
ncbi:hypothetical protein [Litchfieldia salsa]|uniref:Uncharacterized protein n=1 Tax=Litchfieldia salsa TaxID=930152 RepID=A0A1H0X0N4_9BACI|nr:hypothetical protein [Litchfieldia salsa]SDP96295.1 hypothetical protein SAMN05216565_12115 [Litchfieldia salsa]